MKCPRCETDLTPVKVEDTTLDRCLSCGGVWFDFMEMERALSRETAALKGFVLHGVPPRVEETESLPCPRCQGALVRMRAMPENVTHYGCVSCYGRWLDGSQVERVVGRSLSAKFEKLFQMLLG